MQRMIWKGAISFGLVHVPVAVYPASSEGGIDFDWLDKRSMDPVGYKRINKRTGKEGHLFWRFAAIKQHFRACADAGVFCVHAHLFRF